jgi:uncharacterized protein YbaA (DUF1428 family)
MEWRYWTVPNGVNTEFFRSVKADKHEPIIMLFGAMNVIRNVDAAVWFARRMSPKIKQTIPRGSILGRRKQPG